MGPPEKISCRAQLSACTKGKTLACLQPTLLQLCLLMTTQRGVGSICKGNFFSSQLFLAKVEEHHFVDWENISVLKNKLRFYFSVVLEAQKCWWFTCCCLWLPRMGTSPARRLLPATLWHLVTKSNPRSVHRDTPSQWARALSTPVWMHCTKIAIWNGILLIDESWVIKYLGSFLWYVRGIIKSLNFSMGCFVSNGTTRKVWLSKVPLEKIDSPSKRKM